MKRLTALAILIGFIGVPALHAGDEPQFSQVELDRMLAPIALYPDALLSQILVASTYPLEVVEAARWSEEHPELEGDEAIAAVADKDWDPSVQALTAFPRVLGHMNEDLEWTRRLGEAFLLQEEAIMDAIQDLRQEAYEAGSLDSLEHAKVYRDEDIIIIEPADPRIIYVPYYRPRVVYGTKRWHGYPPVYWRAPPGYRSGTGVIWVSGVHVSSRFFYTTCDWHRRHIIVIHHHTAPRDRHPYRTKEFHSSQRWRHDPAHRRGVRYRSEFLEREFGRAPAREVRQTQVRGERRSYIGHEQLRDRLGRDGTVHQPRTFHQRPPSSERAHSYRLRESTRGETRTIRPRINDRSFESRDSIRQRQPSSSIRERGTRPSTREEARERGRINRSDDRRGRPGSRSREVRGSSSAEERRSVDRSDNDRGTNRRFRTSRRSGGPSDTSGRGTFRGDRTRR